MKPSLIAENLGISTATLYRRLSERGFTLGQFRDASGNISDEKMKELKAIFSDGGEYAGKLKEISLLSQKLSEAENSLAEAEKRASDAEARAAVAEAEAVRLSQQLDDLRRQLDDMRQQLEQARADRDKWNKAYEQESRAAAESRALQMQQLQRLLPERVPFTQRVRRMFTRTNKGEE